MSVPVTKLVYATVYAAVDWRLADARSLLAATSLHIKVRTNTVHALRVILGQALTRVRWCPH